MFPNSLRHSTDWLFFGDEEESVTSAPSYSFSGSSDFTETIRYNNYYGEVFSLDIDGSFNTSDFLSLRLNKTKLIAFGRQDFIINYRNSILFNRESNFNLPENFDLNWNIKIGPIAYPSKIAPTVLWIKPERFRVDASETKFIELTNFADSNKVYETVSTVNEGQVGPHGLNNYHPVVFDGANTYYQNTEGTSNFAIPSNTSFVFGFVLDTDKQGTGTKGVVFSSGRNNEDGSFQIYIEETAGARKIGVITHANGVPAQIETTNNCYAQGDSIFVTLGYIDGNYFLNVNGTSQALTGASLHDVTSYHSTSMIGAMENSLNDTVENFLNHNLYELVLFQKTINNDITNSELIYLEGYFAAKYKMTASLPSNHFYKTEPPRLSVINSGNVIPVPTYTVTCSSVTVNTNSFSYFDTGGSNSVSVGVSDPSCLWSATTVSSWITLSSSSGTGNGSFSFTVAQNTDPNPRNGTITVTSSNASATISIAQDQACSVTGFSSASDNYTDAGGTGSVTINTTASNCSWTATSSDSWLTITSGATGTGSSGVISYSVDANTITSSRTATITAGGQTFTVTQDAASSVPWTPSNLSVTPDLWLDANTLSSSLSDGDQVDTWTNLGSNTTSPARDATNSYTGYPKFTTNMLNSLPGVVFPNRTIVTTDDARGTRLWGTPGNANATSDITVVLVAAPSQATANASQMAVASGYFEMSHGRLSAKVSAGWWNGGFSATYATSTISNNTPFLMTAEWDRTNAQRTLWFNGTQEGQSTGLGSSTYSSASTYVIGNNQFTNTSVAQSYQGSIHEMVIVRGNLSSGEREKIEGYLAHKWGLTGNLPSGHPYKTLGPVV